MTYDSLLLENQLCFPLYACSREVVKKYKPYLDEIGLTYTQYIAMMVLWEKKSVNVKELGEALHLDSGTLTPLLKKMESQGLVMRNRSSEDERNLIVTLTKAGEELREKAIDIPQKIGSCLKINRDNALLLRNILNEMLENF